MLAKFKGFVLGYRSRWRSLLFLGIAIASFSTFTLLSAVFNAHRNVAQPPLVTQATIVDIVGQQVLVRDRPARPQDRARQGDPVRTTRARTQLNFNTGAIGRLGQNTVLTIGQQCFQIQQGEILVKGAANGCSNTVRAGVRGTSYWMEVSASGQTEVGVLEGEVELAPLRKTAQESVSLIQGQGIIIDTQGRFGSVTQWPIERFEKILNGPLFQGFQTEFPGLLDVQEALEQVFPGAGFSGDASYQKEPSHS
ncbi:FecR domain-containing protein [Desertifilum sp. FACHB-1129]|uniref:FecR protein domain-containing protein n=2 Tax=Desertifilum tharense IPPAS B-1220 TaxID=1781255 RepID=A0A1E5QQT3_9CYAN|nr:MULTISPECIES: FecR domain-containing protein [Desertifilum]MCD8490285.1 FecR family protein [Desertifilum sp.]MDA0213471.1 FecR domain-containing protein [Cyanobacteria bacterium FC1]MBD2314375.1 FecR domain-containing protein [Desertifilum sp. FACHB-1129]MBD2323308.1 FecR domain-containing protein [Desertifilum sp. FACHB-866]MBD2333153.1 FecR domain-containing protein [Desertifilum sp. FACHB-868]